ncbi:MAG: polysaccharide deacetylase family protein, partial [Acidimicrobiales bacterium]
MAKRHAFNLIGMTVGLSLVIIGSIVGYTASASPKAPDPQAVMVPQATLRAIRHVPITVPAAAIAPRSATVAGGPPAFSVYETPNTPYHPGDKVVALTFDDGPSPVYSPQIVAALAKAGVHGTFFEIGRQAAQYPDITRQVVAAGNVVADHTWSHPDLTKLAISAYPGQIDRTLKLLASLTGRST